MEGRVGVKIGILAVALAVPACIVRLISLILIFPFVRNWPIIAYILFGFSMLVLYGILAVLIVIWATRDEVEEKLYESAGSAVVFGFMTCFPIAMVFLFQGEYYLADAFTTTLVFLCGILLIISGIVMAREVKNETDQVDQENEDRPTH